MIVSDTGWKGTNLGRCYNKYTRVVVFSYDSTDEEIKKIESEMYGQQKHTKSENFGPGDIRVTYTHTVDSSD